MSATPGSNADVVRNSSDNLDRYAKMQLNASEEESKRIRNNASLPNEAWKAIDDTVYPTMDSVLNLVSDLRNLGLTTSEPLEAKSTEWFNVDDDHEATVAMEPETATDEGNQDYTPDGAVLPIIQDDFSIGFRDEGIDGRHVGDTVETLQAESAARAVAEKMEDIALTGWDATVGGDGYTSYGISNHPDVHGGTLSDWTADASAMRDDLRAMFGDIKDDKFFPGNNGYRVYISRNRYDHLEDIDPDGSGDLIMRDRIENLSDLGALNVADFLPTDSVLAFRPTSDVVDLCFAADEQTVQWEGPFRDHFKVMSIMTPRVKSTKNGQCGIAYYTA